MPTHVRTSSRVAIVGGGLAGLAAAVALSDASVPVTLFEARRKLGGRAGSFRDPESGELIDHCQHVSLGCCTNLADFCRRTGSGDAFTRSRVLHFIGPDNRRHDVRPSPWLPAPLHLAPSLARLGYLSWRNRFGIARAMRRLIRVEDAEGSDVSLLAWLEEHRQSPAAIERFWDVVIVSALSESLDRVSLVHARKVFVDGFLASRQAADLYLPRVPLGELYGTRLQRRLAEGGVELRLESPVAQVNGDGSQIDGITLGDGTHLPCERVLLAVPWRRIADLLSPSMLETSGLTVTRQFEAAPITAVHLWFDREITPLPHAVLVGRLSQWLFNHGQREEKGDHAGHLDPTVKYQIVISASRELAGRDRDDVIAEVHDELTAIWPAARSARLLRATMITHREAVFSVRPGIERIRPDQRTPLAGLYVAGDWTQTGWPATMEGAVRSGYLAAEAVLADAGVDRRFVQPDLPRGWLARWTL